MPPPQQNTQCALSACQPPDAQQASDSRSGHKGHAQQPLTGNKSTTNAKGKKPDSRLMLLLVFITGTCVWHLSPASSLVLGLMIGGAFLYWYRSFTLPPRTISRLAKFIALWVALKILMQYGPLLWGQKEHWLLVFYGEETWLGGNAGAVGEDNAGQTLGTALQQGAALFWENYGGELIQTSMFCVQLTSLVMLGLFLVGLYSASTLACAFSWCLRPLRFVGIKESWRLALALALLLQYIPRIFETLDGIRQAAMLRHLPAQGLAYWRMALPRFFTILAEQTWSQAVAIASRKLDGPAPWSITTPVPRFQTVLCCLYALALVGSVALGW